MIPGEAVEAAVEGWLEKSSKPGNWKLEDTLRAALEAAAPLIAAAAWDEGEEAGQDNSDSNRGYNIEHKSNPYKQEQL